MLTYSAAELFGETIRPRMRARFWKITNESLASRLSAIATKLPSVDPSLDGDIKKALISIGQKESIDVMPVATALRHLFVHGIFTPGGTGAVSSRDTAALRDLSLALQKETLQRCSMWVDDLAHRINAGSS